MGGAGQNASGSKGGFLPEETEATKRAPEVNREVRQGTRKSGQPEFYREDQRRRGGPSRGTSFVPFVTSCKTAYSGRQELRRVGQSARRRPWGSG
jgi:hypothetical protein